MSRSYSKQKVDMMLKKESEVWLYSYTDLVTNLLAFFIMILVINVSEPATSQAILDSIASVAGGGGARPVEKDFANSVTQFIEDKQLHNGIDVAKSAEGVSLTFSGSLFFQTLSTELTPEARVLLDQFAPLFVKLPKNFRIDVAGHADSRPVKGNKLYPSNWELSAARSASVVRYLAKRGLNPRRLRAIGYADTIPISTTNMDVNRRVVIRIGKGLVE